MTHQLDFQLTIWSDDAEALLKLENVLHQFERHSDHLGSLDAPMNLYSLVSLFRNVVRIDAHSIDINWDDDYQDIKPGESEGNRWIV